MKPTDNNNAAPLFKRLSKKKKDNSAGADDIVGTVEYHREFKSDFTGTSRDIVVWLPPSYRKNSDKKYPVLYVHDGQNIFDPATSYAGSDWRLDETLTKLIKSGDIEEIIAVGISNTADRLEEYSDSEKGVEYRRFILEELRNFIAENYRVLPDRENTAVMGSSMGGLASMLMLWYRPDTFYKAACLSSSFYYGNGKIFKIIQSYEGERKPIKLYLDSGDDGKRDAQKMFSLLTEKGYIIGDDIDYFFDRGALHNEAAWAGRLERPLKFLFGIKK